MTTKIYNYLSLSGSWEMDYTEEDYLSEEFPSFVGVNIDSAVPGYVEDMTDAFKSAGLARDFKINPEYNGQRYPISATAPDMALPNIVGTFFYRRSFEWAGDWREAYLHFEGIQSAVSVWLNGRFLARHEGYSAPFDMPIPEGMLKRGDNTVVMAVSTHHIFGFDGQLISGITSRAASQYSGGVTGDVEIRTYLSSLRDAAVIIAPDCSSAAVRVELSEKCALRYEVCDSDAVLIQGECEGDFSFDTSALDVWSPESPKLYTLKIFSGERMLERRFGVRRLTVDGVHFRLNGEPYYLCGICEHCYYPETVHPTHDIDFYRNVIRTLKGLGFNFIRFHTHVPPKEYMQAADELGMLMHIESPNNTTLSEWREIVDFCSKYTSTVVYCCGNEMQLYDDFIDHIERCADYVHQATDSLFSPMSALRGLEYCWCEPDQDHLTVKEPFRHHPKRFERVGKFADLYNSFSLSQVSYNSLDADVKKLDDWSRVYGKPRVTHEICIDGTYTDLSLEERYKGTRIGEQTEMFSSIREHLKDKGVLEKAPLYFKNSCEWQRRVRKYCFEAVRRCENMAGYDFLGPIDTHWHTFGYDVGMMNEFYEMKPGESVKNVLRYNSPTVLLNDIGTRVNFTSGESLKCGIFASLYGIGDAKSALLQIELTADGEQIYHTAQTVPVECGRVMRLCDLAAELPRVDKPKELKLSASLAIGGIKAENEWELYLFPRVCEPNADGLTVCYDMTADELITSLKGGEDVVLLGHGPFPALVSTYRIALAGRTRGNLATVINEHPILADLPHEDFCSWQFRTLLEGAYPVAFVGEEVPFDPIIEVVSTHKNVIRQAALFELSVCSGRLIVCGFNFDESDPCALWLKSEIIKYAKSDAFNPKNKVGEREIRALMSGEIDNGETNTNVAVNPNDKTAVRKKKSFDWF